MAETNKKSNIAVLINTYLRPSEVFIYEQIRAVTQYNVHVLSRSSTHNPAFEHEHVHTIADNNKMEALCYTLTRNSPYFNKTIKEHNIRLIHAHFGTEGVYALPLAKRNCIPLITTFHGHDITRLPKATVWPISWAQYYLHFTELKERGTVFLAVSDFIKKRLIERGFSEDKIITHHLGIPIPKLPTAAKDTLSIVTVGRLVEKKGTEHVIRAMKVVSESFPDAHLTICGDGPLRANLEQLVDALKLKNNITFAGWKTKQEILDILAKASVFVLPSVTAQDGDCEGLGMVLLEAMSVQAPVIGTYHGGIPEAVKDGVNGYLVKERNPQEIAEKIIYLLNNPAVAVKMGTEGRKIVEANFNIAIQIKKLEGIYSKFVG